jgi:hypothetical protein
LYRQIQQRSTKPKETADWLGFAGLALNKCFPSSLGIEVDL